MTTAASKQLGYIPALDGLRAAAVMLVVFSHTRVLGFQNGDFGVEMFFVLSGFLISTLLLQEMDGTGGINVPHFYARRLLRLYPALLLFLLLYAVAAHALHVDFMRDVFIAGFYLTDYAVTFGAASPGSLVNHTWSLSVEEQFYLLWPLALLGLNKIVSKKRLPAVMLALALVALARELVPLLMGADWTTVYFRFDARLGGLLLGACLAACRRAKIDIPFKAWGFALSGIALVICMMVPVGYTGGLLETPAAQAFTFFLLASLLENKASLLRDMFEAPGAVFLGRISYGVYLFHYPIAVILREYLSWPLACLVTFAASTGIAWFSWSTVERIGRLKSSAFRGKSGLMPAGQGA